LKQSADTAEASLKSICLPDWLRLTQINVSTCSLAIHQIYGIGVEFNVPPNISEAVFAAASHLTDTEKIKQFRKTHKLNATQKQTLRNTAKQS